MTSASSQNAILAPIPKHARIIEFSLKQDTTTTQLISILEKINYSTDMLIGLGPDIIKLFGKEVQGFHSFKSYQEIECAIPETQASLAIRIENEDCGKIAKSAREITAVLSECFAIARTQNSFIYLDGHDLTGYEDGTENPDGDDAEKTALISSTNPNLNGSSILTIQRWDHDIPSLQNRPQDEQDHIIGRRLSDNEELDDAPQSAHVKRTAQESFEPEAFILRRSMPWSDEKGEGLLFMCFSANLYAFEAQLERMIGLEDNIIDGLFKFSTPKTGAHYWCPPIQNEQLNLNFLR
ncbi:Dyp-type peroxidase [Curvivirga aplysinae]|uniref:Dyp-type peroxidase n=1 Tax=Curvivirga aplysinae TaxID=2529852 RepID=UPI0012BBEEE2|nr:Dyp-type peroxidase [Curvivirga aplysinae]MTI09286.1 Dyp-type peroxidase [Curvivirga aplysinae]